MITVTQVLDDLERRIAGVQAALDAGDDPHVPTFVPATEPVRPATMAEVTRYERLMDRLAALEERIRREQAELAGELSGLDRRREAATAYAVNG